MSCQFTSQVLDGLCPFQKQSLRRIQELKQIYHLDLDASASHRLIEATPAGDERKSAKPRNKS
jgi:hypothetical protein